MLFVKYTHLYVAIYKPNYLLGSLRQSFHQNCYSCNRKHCLCYSSIGETLRNYRSLPIRIVRMTSKCTIKLITKLIRIKNNSHNLTNMSEIILTFTKEQTKQALKPRKSFGIVSNDISIGNKWFICYRNRNYQNSRVKCRSANFILFFSHKQNPQNDYVQNTTKNQIHMAKRCILVNTHRTTTICRF